ncbi:stage II sporulation protein M [Paenibacillus sp. FSL K6-2524]|uniref:stage II sporulation protein M n=1 Tax=Paenibacillus sp. FSL K6-2524 TaxID=2954516 RepID=UPI0030F6DA04
MTSLRRFVQDLFFYKKMMALSLILFTAGIVIGTLNADFITELITPQLQGLQEYSRELSESANPQWSFFVFIFLNNAVKSIVIIFAGALFGLLPIFFLMMNGMVIGFLLTTAASQGENMFDLIVLGLLPHGIIEIPAILIASGFGLQFGYMVLKGLGELGARDESERTVKWGGFLKTAGRASIWITLLLLIAAIIESTLTFYLVTL